MSGLKSLAQATKGEVSSVAQERVMVCMDYNGMTTIEDLIRGRPTWEGNEKDAIKELKKILKRVGE